MTFTIKPIAAASLAFLLTIGMVACTTKNAPTDSSGDESGEETVQPGDTTITTTDTLRISWSGANASVAGQIDGVSVTNSNGYVTVTSTVQRQVTYLLSGNGQGQLTIYGVIKHQLVLNDLTLTCSDGPAINNQCKKKCYVVLNGTNSLTDGSSYATSTEDRKAAFFSEGQMIFSGNGSLTIKGNYKHALASDDYIRFAPSTGSLDLTAASDGIHANDGIYFEGGSFSISAGEEGVQCDTSVIVIDDGAITVTQAGDKGITAFDTILVNGGTIRVTSAYKCIKTKGNLVINGGDIQVVCTGTSSGGGGNPWGGGSSSSSSPEGVEAKGTITINGGFLYSQSADDAINSGGDMTINGGYVCAYSTGNDGMDANGNLYIKGGVVYAIGARSPEVAIDANSEQQKKLYVSGGTIVTIGGLESGSQLTQACYQASSVSNGKWYALYNDSELVLAFKAVASTTPMVVSTSGTPSLKLNVTTSGGTSIFNGNALLGASVSGGTNVSLSSYTSSGGGSGGGGGPGGGGGRPGGW